MTGHPLHLRLRTGTVDYSNKTPVPTKVAGGVAVDDKDTGKNGAERSRTGNGGPTYDPDEFQALDTAEYSIDANGQLTIKDVNSLGDTLTRSIQDQYGQNMASTGWFLDGDEILDNTEVTAGRHVFEFRNGDVAGKFYLTAAVDGATISVASAKTSRIVTTETELLTAIEDKVNTITVGKYITMTEALPIPAGTEVVVSKGVKLETAGITINGDNDGVKDTDGTDGILTVKGVLVNAHGKNVVNNGAIVVTGKYTVNAGDISGLGYFDWGTGSLHILGASTISSAAAFKGRVVVEADSKLTVNADVAFVGTIEVAAKETGAVADGELEIAGGKKATLDGTLTVEGKLTATGDLTLADSATLDVEKADPTNLTLTGVKIAENATVTVVGADGEPVNVSAADETAEYTTITDAVSAGESNALAEAAEHALTALLDYDTDEELEALDMEGLGDGVAAVKATTKPLSEIASDTTAQGLVKDWAITNKLIASGSEYSAIATAISNISDNLTTAGKALVTAKTDALGTEITKFLKDQTSTSNLQTALTEAKSEISAYEKTFDDKDTYKAVPEVVGATEIIGLTSGKVGSVTAVADHAEKKTIALEGLGDFNVSETDVSGKITIELGTKTDGKVTATITGSDAAEDQELTIVIEGTSYKRTLTYKASAAASTFALTVEAAAEDADVIAAS